MSRRMTKAYFLKRKKAGLDRMKESDCILLESPLLVIGFGMIINEL